MWLPFSQTSLPVRRAVRLRDARSQRDAPAVPRPKRAGVALDLVCGHDNSYTADHARIWRLRVLSLCSW